MIIYSCFALIAFGLLFFLGGEIAKQRRAKKRRVHYKRIPVIHPKRSTHSSEQIPTSTHLPNSESRSPQQENPKSSPKPIAPFSPVANPGSPPHLSPASPTATDPPFTPSNPSEHPIFTQSSNPAIPDVVPIFKRRIHPLKAQLVRHLNGDEATADRLLQNVRLRYPDRSEGWLIEKCIHDLDRDRL